MHTKKSTNTVVAKTFNKQRKRTKTSVELFTLTCYYDVRIFQIQCLECLHDLLNKHVQLTSVVKLMNAFGLSKLLSTAKCPAPRTHRATNARGLRGGGMLAAGINSHITIIFKKVGGG